MLVVARVEQCVDKLGVAVYSATVLGRAGTLACRATRIFLANLSWLHG
jgi:hypothetical protein